jgi:hypothetical protein
MQGDEPDVEVQKADLSVHHLAGMTRVVSRGQGSVPAIVSTKRDMWTLSERDEP